MKMKKILSEWKKFTLREQQEEQINISERLKTLKNILDYSLDTERTSQYGNNEYRKEFEKIVGRPFLKVLTRKVEDNRPKVAKLEKYLKDSREALEQIDVNDDSGYEGQVQHIKEIIPILEEAKENLNSPAHALNGVSFYLLGEIAEYNQIAKQSSKRGTKSRDIIEKKLASLKADIFIETLKSHADARDNIDFLKNSFYNWKSSLFEYIAQDQSAYTTRATVTGTGPSIVDKPNTIHGVNDWHFGNPSSKGGFNLFIDELEKKLNQDPEIGPLNTSENQPEWTQSTPEENPRMQDFISAYKDIQGEDD